ncbi:Flp family type IVb pilin [Syntrophus gentianae]|nr:Flp family type IVb pilin [Syntrophus gentianae]
MEEMKRFIRDEAGATAVECGLIIALIAAVIFAIVGILSRQM